jgi:ABC-type multidrug transport system permease subunit
VLVADQDDSFLSNFLVGALSQEAAGSFIRAEDVELEEGLARMAKGEATALLVIPSGFSSAILREEPSTLRLVVNPSERILPQIVEESLSLFTDAVFYLHRLLGDDLRLFAEDPEGDRNTYPDAQIAAFSVQVNHLADRLSNSLSPLAIELETTTDKEPEAAEETQTSNLALLLLPGILFMSLLFMSQGFSEDLWREREQKTLRRLVVSPQPVTAFLAGKAVASSLMMGAICLVALSLGFAYFRLPFSRLPLAVCWTALAGTLLLFGMWVLQLHARGQRAGNILTFCVMIPLMMLGGSFFPFEAMPAWMVAVGRFTPNGWALRQLKTILGGEFSSPDLARALGLLAIMGLILFAFSTWRLRSRFARG